MSDGNGHIPPMNPFDGEWAPLAIGAAEAFGHGDLEKHFAACLAEGTGDIAAERGLPC